MKQSYWFYLEPYVHISVKGNNALVYNPLNGKIIEKNNPVIVNLVKTLNSKKNLLVTKLSGEELAEPCISTFVKEVRRHYAGDLIDTSYSLSKPFQMRPQVKIQKDAEESGTDGESSVGEGVMEYLTEISLYINNRCGQHCSVCQNAYRQFPFCTKSSSGKIQELEIEAIRQLLSEARGSAIHRLNILGGDIFAYSKFEQLVGFLKVYKKLKTYNSHYLNLHHRHRELKLITDDFFSLAVLIDFPVNEDKLKDTVTMLDEVNRDVEFVFLMQKEEEIEAAQEICARLIITNFTFKPFYNGKNLDFFKDNVFVNKQALLQLKPNLKQIYSRIKTNPLNFGKITVLSNGAIYANVNANRVGGLGRDSLYDVVLTELYDGRSWRKSRDKVRPCKSCVYCFLCPPLTNYEHQLRRNNLCSIWE
jgi:pseudo-rSAM protein